jgi:putative secretion ATPase (PEP-CTERM system associated)
MYETYYQLTGKPFQLNPDPSFFFASKGHSRAFAYLKYGVYQGDGFIVITGEIGAGKTTMVKTLLDELDSERIVAAQLISTQLDANDLVHAVAAAFGLPNQELSKPEMLAQFEAFLTSLVGQERRALLIVDEAQNLKPEAMEELRMLSNFQLGSRSLLQSFLVGQPELRDTLRGPSMEQLRQRIIASYHLGPMDRKETRAYVLHRLDRVGWKGDPQLDEAIFDRLFEATGGLPRTINAVCNRLFLGASLEEKHAIGPAEFAETIKEMRDELGPKSQANAQPDMARASLREPPGIARPLISAALTARLERIEKSVTQAVDLLQQISGQETGGGATATTTPASANQRARFGVRPHRP